MPGKKLQNFTEMDVEDINRIIYTRICPAPECGEPFTVERRQGRLPSYCSPECKRATNQASKAHVPRYCAFCKEFFETDMRGMMGTPSDYCSEECQLQYKKLSNYRANHTCMLKGCDTYIGRARRFCSEEHTLRWHQDEPDRLHAECFLPGCTEPTPFDPADLKPCPKFCSQEHRDEYTAGLGINRILSSYKKSNAPAKKKARKFKNAKKGEGAFRIRPIVEFGYMVAGHNTKRSWTEALELGGDRNERYVKAAILAGWQNEEEFLTVEDPYPPAMYLKVEGLPLAERSPVWLPVRYQNKGEGTTHQMDPDPDRPSPEELDAMLDEYRT